LPSDPQKVYSPDVVLTWPGAPRGRPRQRLVPDVRPLAAHDALELQKWRTVTWRRGTKGPLRARSRRCEFASQTERLPAPENARTSTSQVSKRSGSSASVGRAKVLAVEPPSDEHPQNTRRDHQGAVAVRAGPSAAHRGTWPRSLRDGAAYIATLS